MKVLAILLLIALAYTSAKPVVSDAKKQQDVMRLLYKVTEPIRSRFTDLKDAANHFDPNSDHSIYKDNGKAVEELCKKIDEHNVLEKHHWFSLFNEDQRHDALMLFEVLMNCKSWDCAIKSAAYFRERLNEGVFVYALYVTVIHHPATSHLALPPMYEVTPHMFANTDAIQKAYAAKMKQTPGKFHMEFTGSQKNPEQRVAYFGEDIGLGVHHVTWHMDYPFWWEDKYGHHFDRKGELFFWVHHQLTARFDAERLSNNLGIVNELYWDKPIHEGFAPQTTYKYGGEFPSRPDNVQFTDVDGIARVRDMILMERRIKDAIAHGYVINDDGGKIDIRNEQGIDVLGSIIESSMYNPNPSYYGSLHNTAHVMLGRLVDPKGKFGHPPGVMEHFETATRDPAFFRLHKYIDNMFKLHKDTLPPYTEDDLAFNGIAIDSVSIDGKLETFLEDFDFSLEMGVDDTEQLEDVPISAIVSRLNHQPFSFNIDVSNNNNAKTFATVRIHLCPRKDENGMLFTLEEGRWHCVELDKFWRTLKPGKNHIVRKSTEASTTVNDSPSFKKLMGIADAAVKSGATLDVSDYIRSCGIPNRLLIPKGTTQGLEFVLLVAITDGTKDAAVDGLENDERGGSHAQCGIHGEKYPDKKPLGFPLDRHLESEKVLLHYPNFSKTVIVITHNDK